MAGQGVVGQLLVQLARASGAWPVIAVDTVRSRLERSLQGGAHFAVNPLDGHLERAVLELARGRGADVCFEATRTPRALASVLAVAALNARVVMVGSIHAAAEIELFEGIQRKELTVVGAWQPRARPSSPPRATPGRSGATARSAWSSSSGAPSAWTTSSATAPGKTRFPTSTGRSSTHPATG